VFALLCCSHYIPPTHSHRLYLPTPVISFAFVNIECNEHNVKKVFQEVSTDNLSLIQADLFEKHQEAIIEHINTRPDYVFEKHDSTVHFWFKTGNPSWKELINILNSCNENVVAAKIDSGEIFEEINSPEFEGVHFPESLSMLTLNPKEKGKHFFVLNTTIYGIYYYDSFMV